MYINLVICLLVLTSVLEKQKSSPFKLDGAVLTVHAYVPPPIDRRKIFLAGLKEGMSTESLEVFLEVICGMCPASVQYGETPGTVLLTFDEEPGIYFCSVNPFIPEDQKPLQTVQIQMRRLVTSRQDLHCCSAKNLWLNPCLQELMRPYSEMESFISETLGLKG